MQDADYLSRTDTDLNGNGIPDRLEDSDGDGVPDNLDVDMDGDGTPNAIDPDSLDPTVTGGAGGIGTAPIVTAVTPSFGHQGDSNLLLTIDGAYFQSGATVLFSGVGITVLDVPAIYVGATQVQVHVNIDAAATVGFRNITVTNSGGLAGMGTNIFEVITSGGGSLPTPSIAQVVPSNVEQGASAISLTITGQNIVSGATLSFSQRGYYDSLPAIYQQLPDDGHDKRILEPR